MAAGTKNLTIEQGATFPMVITYKLKSTGQPIDLTGYAARLQIRKTVDSPTVLLDLMPTLGGASGTIDCSLTAAQTTALTFDSGVYDVTLTSPVGVVKRLLQGTVTLSKGVTR